ncbi:hypothetical protein HKD37_10G028310 [Glycine soja]
MYTLSLMLTDEVNTSSIRKELEIIRKDYESYLKIKVGMKEMKDNKNNLLLESVFLHQFLALKRLRLKTLQIKIPKGSVFHATRGEERLKLFAQFLEKEESQEK